jgi:hypothetical protein
MPDPHLNDAGVVASVGQRVAAGLALHVGMSLQLEAGRCCPLDHPREEGIHSLDVPSHGSEAPLAANAIEPAQQKLA